MNNIHSSTRSQSLHQSEPPSQGEKAQSSNAESTKIFSKQNFQKLRKGWNRARNKLPFAKLGGPAKPGGPKSEEAGKPPKSGDQEHNLREIGKKILVGRLRNKGKPQAGNTALLHQAALGTRTVVETSYLKASKAKKKAREQKAQAAQEAAEAKAAAMEPKIAEAKQAVTTQLLGILTKDLQNRSEQVLELGLNDFNRAGNQLIDAGMPPNSGLSYLSSQIDLLKGVSEALSSARSNSSEMEINSFLQSEGLFENAPEDVRAFIRDNPTELQAIVAAIDTAASKT